MKNYTLSNNTQKLMSLVDSLNNFYDEVLTATSEVFGKDMADGILEDDFNESFKACLSSVERLVMANIRDNIQTIGRTEI